MSIALLAFSGNRRLVPGVTGRYRGGLDGKRQCLNSESAMTFAVASRWPRQPGIRAP